MSTEKAVFAAGCFWGVEDAFRKHEGVIDAVSGYCGGTMPDPDYKSVCSGQTGHAEAVEVTFDPDIVTYRQLVDFFFSIHNPTTMNRQGPDVGSQYRSAIFCQDEAQKEIAEAAVKALNDSGRFDDPVVTEINGPAPFWKAEEYHQRYFEKNGGGACHI